MKKDLKEQALTQLPTAKEPQPPPTEFPVVLGAWCKIPGTCYPVDTHRFGIPDALTYTVLTNALSGFFFLIWIPAYDPSLNSTFDALTTKWRTTGSPL